MIRALVRPPRPLCRPTLRAARLVAISSLLGLAGAGSLEAAAPEWLKEIARQPVPRETGPAPATVILDRTVETVDTRGNVTTVHQVAFRVHDRQVGKRVGGQLGYLDGSDRILGAEAWLLREARVVRTAPNREWLDFSKAGPLSKGQEYRQKSISFPGQWEAGDVFGYETRLQSQLVTAQMSHSFGGDLPVEREVWQVQLPRGFQLSVATSARPIDRASQEGNQWTWECWRLPWNPPEEWAPNEESLRPRVHISLRPPSTATRFAPPVFNDWAEVVNWLRPHYQTPAADREVLASAAHSLAPPEAETTRLIENLTGRVQQIRYLALSTNLELGEGFRPRPPGEVLQSGWGDCKDKANLLRSLLEVRGIRSYAVLVNAFAGWPVDPDLASPLQFNHALVAIQVGPEMEGPAVHEDGELGRLLFFDPTDPNVPLGYLPCPLQGAPALILVPDRDHLLELPIATARDAGHASGRVRLRLLPGERVEGRVTLDYHGALADLARQLLEHLSRRTLEDATRAMLIPELLSPVISQIETTDQRAGNRYTLAFTFTSYGAVQVLPGDQAVLWLDLVHRDIIPRFHPTVRHRPVMMPPILVEDEVVLELPENTVVVDQPPISSEISPYGSHQVTSENRDGEFVFRRRWEMSGKTVPVEEYAELRRFLLQSARAEHAPLLLQFRRRDAAPSGNP